jgi:hypothetical protein
LTWFAVMNLHRRYLDESQRALIGEKMATMRGGNSWKNNSPNLESDAKSVAQAAKIMNVSTSSNRLRAHSAQSLNV